MWHYFTSSDPHLDTLVPHSFWHTIWKFVYLCIFKHTAHAFIYIYITLYIYIFIYTFSDILPDILPGNTLTFFPVSGIYSDTLFLHIIWHFFWDSIWCVFWHFSWHSIWHSFWSRRGPQHPDLAYHPELAKWPRPSPDRWGTTGKSSLQYLQWLSQQAWALKPQTLVKTNHVKVVESAACFGERVGLG